MGMISFFGERGKGDGDGRISRKEIENWDRKLNNFPFLVFFPSFFLRYQRNGPSARSASELS